MNKMRVESRILKSTFIFLLLFLSYSPHPTSASALQSPIIQPAAPVGYFSTSLAYSSISVAPGGTLFMVGDGDLYVSRDGGQMWDVNPFWKDGVQYFNVDLDSVVSSPDFQHDGMAIAVALYSNFPFWITRDFGFTWTAIDWGSTSAPYHPQVKFSPNYAVDHTIYACNPLKKSTDSGKTWAQIATPNNNSIDILSISPNYAVDHSIFANIYAADYPILKTSDEIHWFPANNGLTDSNGQLVWNIITVPDGLTSDGSPILLATTSDEIKVSYNLGDSWATLVQKSVVNLMASKSKTSNDFELFALNAHKYELLHSLDSGKNWTAISMNPIGAITLSPDYASNGIVFSNSTTGISKSMDRGKTWQLIKPNMGLNYSGNLVVLLSPDYENDRTLFAYSKTPYSFTGANPTSYLKSTDGGQTWKVRPLPFMPADYVPWRMAISPNFGADHTIFISNDKIVYRSTDAGSLWSMIGTPAPGAIRFIKVPPNYPTSLDLYIVTSSNEVDRGSNNGQTWQIIKPAQGVAISPDIVFSPSFATDHTLFINSGLAYKSVNSGDTWEYLPSPDYTDGLLAISPNFSVDHTLFWGSKGSTGSGMYKSTNTGQTWAPMPIPTSGFATSIVPSPHYAQDQTLIACNAGTPYISEDGGTTWNKLPTGNAAQGLDLAYENGLLTMFMAFGNVVYRYDWPKLTTISPVFKMVPAGSADPIQLTLSMQSSHLASPTWNASSPAVWVNLPEAHDTYPGQLHVTLNPEGLSGVNQTQIDLDVYFSAQQKKTVSIPVTLLLYTDQAWLPGISR